MEWPVTLTQVYCSAISHQSTVCPTFPFSPLAPAVSWLHSVWKVRLSNTGDRRLRYSTTVPSVINSSRVGVVLFSMFLPPRMYPLQADTPQVHLAPPATCQQRRRNQDLISCHLSTPIVVPQSGPSSSVPPQSYLCGLSLFFPPNGICWELSGNVCFILFIFSPSLFNNLSKALCWILLYLVPQKLL